MRDLRLKNHLVICIHIANGSQDRQNNANRQTRLQCYVNVPTWLRVLFQS